MSRRAAIVVDQEIEFVSYPSYPKRTRDIEGGGHSWCEAHRCRGVR